MAGTHAAADSSLDLKERMTKRAQKERKTRRNNYNTPRLQTHDRRSSWWSNGSEVPDLEDFRQKAATRSFKKPVVSVSVLSHNWIEESSGMVSWVNHSREMNYLRQLDSKPLCSDEGAGRRTRLKAIWQVFRDGSSRLTGSGAQ